MRIRPLALLATLLLPLPLLAQTYNYTYTGDDFNTPQSGGGYTYLSGAYTGSDFVSITFTVPEPLPDNLVDTNPWYTVAPLSWSISDGIQSNSSTDYDAFYGIGIEVTTNATGQIVGWHVFEQFQGRQIETEYNGPLDINSGDYGFDPFSPGGEALLSSFPGTPGSWSGPVSSVPEGSSYPLLLLSGACLFGVGFFRFRKGAGAGEAA
jgi:hypothetical protein